MPNIIINIAIYSRVNLMLNRLPIYHYVNFAHAAKRSFSSVMVKDSKVLHSMIFLAVIYCYRRPHNPFSDPFKSSKWSCLERALKVSTIVSKLFSLALQILCLYVKYCRKRSRHSAYVKYCQTQSVTDSRELYLICHIMNETSLNVNVKTSMTM